MRYPELDLARGFTVLMMPAVHVTMLYGNEAVYNSWWGLLLNWVATMPGAQLFMLLMGMSFSLSPAKKSWRAIALKISRWMMLAYALNFLKFIVPAAGGWLPEEFYSALGLSAGVGAQLRLLLVGDILQLAACSLGIIYLINRLELSIVSILLIAAAVIFISPLLWPLQVNSALFNELASLFTGNDPLVFFPLFPWLLFPLMGLLLGRVLQEGSLNYVRLSVTGCALMLPEVLQHGFHFTLAENLYRSRPLAAIYHTGFCFCWLGLCSFLTIIIKDPGSFRLLKFCSKHITVIYCMQWITIFWCIAILPYRGLSTPETMVISLLLSCVVLLLTRFFTNKYNSSLNQQLYG